MDSNQFPSVGTDIFPPTRWSLITEASTSRDMKGAEHAMEELCNSYWNPIYIFIRSRHHDRETSRDLTQGFFLHILGKGLFLRANPERGKLRAFLVTSLKNYLAKEHRNSIAQKRGGGEHPISFDIASAEQLHSEVGRSGQPDTVFAKSWALAILENVGNAVRNDYETRGKADLFKALEPHLTLDGSPDSHAQVAEDLGLSASAVKAALHRLRSHFRVKLRQEVAETLASGSDIDEEITELMATLRES